MVESSLHVPKLSEMRLYVYRRPLHPELFGIFLEKKLTMDRYEADLCLLGLGHMVRFNAEDSTITELVSMENKLLPETGRLETFCAEGTREFRFSLNESIYYVINLHAEQMSDPVFERVYNEMIQFGQERGLFMLFEQWATDELSAPFSLIDYEHRPTELGIFAYHMFPARKIMLSTQSIFSLEPIGELPVSRADIDGNRP